MISQNHGTGKRGICLRLTPARRQLNGPCVARHEGKRPGETAPINATYQYEGAQLQCNTYETSRRHSTTRTALYCTVLYIQHHLPRPHRTSTVPIPILAAAAAGEANGTLTVAVARCVGLFGLFRLSRADLVSLSVIISLHNIYSKGGSPQPTQPTANS